jgi:hypothetical protein
MPLKIKAMLVMDQLPVCNCDEARRMLEIEPLVQERRLPLLDVLQSCVIEVWLK